jgi:hypothetical protein
MTDTFLRFAAECERMAKIARDHESKWRSNGFKMPNRLNAKIRRRSRSTDSRLEPAGDFAAIGMGCG